MFTCDACHGIPLTFPKRVPRCAQEVLPSQANESRCALVDGQHQDRSERLQTPWWDALRAEAELEVEREPFLRESIHQFVLNHESIGEGLANLLATKLAGHPGEISRLREQMIDVLREHPWITQAVERDLFAIRHGDPATNSLLHPYLNYKGFHALQAYRIAHALWRVGRESMAYHLQSRISEVWAVDIHPAAKIGSGVFIDHATSVVIGETAVVGDDVTILHGVTLGGTGNESGDRHPKVGRGVFIGAGAQLLGNIRIGDDSRIGASSVVLREVPPRSTVAGIPAKVVRDPSIASNHCDRTLSVVS